MRERLIEILKGFRTPICEGLNFKLPDVEAIADYLLAEGVIVPPKQTSQEERWEKNMEHLRSGGFGSLEGKECYETLIRYWKAQEKAGYPKASENVRYFEEAEKAIAERSKE